MKRYSFLILLLAFNSAFAQERPVLDIMLSNYEYPFKVHFQNIKSQNQELKMAYMDIHSQKPNGKTIVLMHGKNFNGAYWKTTIEALSKDRYRVVVPD